MSLFPSHPVRHFSFYFVCPLLSGSSFNSTICLSPRPGDRRNQKSKSSIPFDLTIVIFFQILLFSSKFHHPFRAVGTKKRNPSVHPSARGFPYDCIRESRYTDAAIVLLDIHSISKEVRGAVTKIALYATIRQTESFQSAVLSRFWEPSLKPSL